MVGGSEMEALEPDTWVLLMPPGSALHLLPSPWHPCRREGSGHSGAGADILLWQGKEVEVLRGLQQASKVGGHGLGGMGLLPGPQADLWYPAGTQWGRSAAGTWGSRGFHAVANRAPRGRQGCICPVVAAVANGGPLGGTRHVAIPQPGPVAWGCRGLGGHCAGWRALHLEAGDSADFTPKSPP